MARNWRLNWAGRSDRPGKVVVRLATPVVTQPAAGQAFEVLQVGIGAGSASMGSCLSSGLVGAKSGRLPDRAINGARFSVWSNSKAGMNQSIAAIDLRAVVGGRRYAVERFSYAVCAAGGTSLAVLPAARGRASLNAARASLRLGPEPAPPS